MKINTLKCTIWAFVLTAIPFAYLAYLWDTLPAKLALDIGKSNRIGSKEQIFEQLIIMAVISLIIYFVVTFNKSINPKQSTNQAKRLSAKFGLTMVAFFSTLSLYTIHTAIVHELNNFLFIILGLFTSLSGNFMHSIPYKHPLGMRLPWVLESESNWRKTHQFASKIQFFTGLALVAVALFVPENRLLYPWTFCLCVISAVPVIYSYWWA